MMRAQQQAWHTAYIDSQALQVGEYKYASRAFTPTQDTVTTQKLKII